MARRIEEALAGRRGSNQYQQKVDTQNLADAPKGESRDIAAKAVGLNRETYRQAKAVVDSGNQEGISGIIPPKYPYADPYVNPYAGAGPDARFTLSNALICAGKSAE